MLRHPLFAYGNTAELTNDLFDPSDDHYEHVVCESSARGIFLPLEQMYTFSKLIKHLST